MRSAGSRRSGGVGVVVAESGTRQPATGVERPAAGAATDDERTYVLDTSVLLSDPKAIFRFAEHAVVIPVVVISELEGKRNDPEIGYFARQALRNLDELRVAARTARLPDPGRRRRLAAGRAEPLQHVRAAERAAARRQRLAHPRGRAEPGERRARRDGRLQGPPAARQGRVDRSRRRGVPARARRRLRLDRARRASPSAASQMATLYDARVDADRRWSPDFPVNTGLIIHSDRGSALGRVTGGAARSSSCAATATSSGCTGGRRSSGSRSTCCSTRRSASSRSAAEPAPASRRSPSAPASRRCSSASSTRRSWCSVRSTRSAARSSATCPATRARR